MTMRMLAWMGLMILVLVGIAPGAEPQGAIPITAETAQKPQSKLWYDQHTWWAALPQNQGVLLWRYAGGHFEPQPKPGPLTGTAANSECDVLVQDDTLFVLCYQRNPNSTLIHAFKFVNDVYKELPGYPVTLGYKGRAATMTCDVDSKGWLWVAYVNESQQVVVQGFMPALQQTNPHQGFSAPFVLGTTAGQYDIAAVRAFKGHVGVMWSDQKVERFCFRAHRDGKPADQWEPEEVALAGKDMVNDHLSLAADSAGNLYAVTKAQTGPQRPPAALVLSRRSPDGKWGRVASIVGPGQDKTRPIVVLDGSGAYAYIVYTDRVAKPNVISLTPVTLPDGKPGKEIVVLKADYDLNNATGSRSPVTEATGLMILAGAKDPKAGQACFRLLDLKDMR